MTALLSNTRTTVLIADGLIPTTHILRRLLDESYGAVKVVLPEQLPGVNLSSARVFISRLCHPRYRWLPAYLRGRGIEYVYFLDDNFHVLTPEYDAINGAFFSHPATQAALKQFLQGAKFVWVMSPVLRDYIAENLSDVRTRLTHAPVDIALFDAAVDRALQTARVGSQRTSPFRVGYPTSRRPNVAQLISAVVRGGFDRWGHDVRFEFVGWCPQEIAGMPNVNLTPQIDGYEAFVNFMANEHWDCAIAPLGDSAFENCKTNLKYREYAAARVPGIYSDCPLYRNCVRNNETGLLCDENAESWLDAIEAMRRSELRQSIATAAYGDVTRHYAQSKIAATIRENFFTEPTQIRREL